MKKYVLLNTLIFCVQMLFAQQPLQTVFGVVTEKSTKEPLVGSLVVLNTKKGELAVMTDEKGKFKFDEVPVGRCDISVTFTGFSPFVANHIMVYSGKETALEIELEENIQELSEIEVVAKVNKELPLNKMATVSVRMLSSEEANRYAGSWGDPSRMAANLAGVAAANDSRNDIIIRGNSPTGLMWRVDGFEIPNPNHFGAMGGTGGPIGMLNNNQLANSDFYTGAFPAEFGNATSGVFDLRLRNGNNRRHEFLGSLGFNGAELGAEGPINTKTGASYMINGRYSFLSILDAMGFTMSGTQGAVPEYQDVSAKINIPLPKGNLSWVTLWGASHIDSHSDMTDESEWKPGDKGNAFVQKNFQIFSGINYTHRFSTNTRLENRLSYQFFESEVNTKGISYPELIETPEYEGNSSEGKISFSTTLYHRLNPRNFIQGGVGADLYKTDLYDVNKDTILHNSDKNTQLLRGFVEWRHRFSNALSITSGVYSQVYTLNSDKSIEPRIGLKWAASNRSTFSLGAGLYSQIQPRLVYLYEKEGVLVNDRLKMSRSRQIVGGYDFKLAESMRFKAELYYQSLYKIPVIPDTPEESLLNFGDDFHNNWDDVFVNEGTGRNYGIDLTFEKFFDKSYYFLITGSLYDSRYKGYDRVERHTKFAGNFAVNTLFGYEWKIGKASLVSANVKLAYMGGKRFLPATVSHEGGDWVFDYSEAYTKHLPNYFKCDLNLNMKNNFKKIAVEWFIDLNNITNHKNVWIHYYNSNRQKEEYLYQYGFMPIGGFRLYFHTKPR